MFSSRLCLSEVWDKGAGPSSPWGLKWKVQDGGLYLYEMKHIYISVFSLEAFQFLPYWNKREATSANKVLVLDKLLENQNFFFFKNEEVIFCFVREILQKGVRIREKKSNWHDLEDASLANIARCRKVDPVITG